MVRVFKALVGATLVVEEFIYPGGLLDLMKSFNRTVAPFITVRFAVEELVRAHFDTPSEGQRD